jgi:serine phosphatase RsbU (regulator of sigma subunit)/anti-sigma regulatory factor (Ser/Thr protein kinase)
VRTFRRRNSRPEARRPTYLEDGFGSGAFAFRHRLSIGAMIAVLALAAVASILAWRQYDNGKQEALSQTHARVVLAAAILDTFFQGDLSTLSAIAAAPAVVTENESAMRSYFRRVQPPGGKLFNGGLAAIDLKGNAIVSSAIPVPPPVNVSGRSYFKTVVATRKPFVSAGLRARSNGRQIIVMAVPTHDTRGGLTGVLAGALLVNPKGNSKASLDLGFAGLSILDRDGQLVLAGLRHPLNSALLPELTRQRVGVLSNSKGLDGSSGHVVAFATALVPGWTIAIDRPRSAVFAGARRALLLDLALIAAGGLLGLALISWILLRARREEAKAHERSHQWGELTRALGAASATSEVADALLGSLATAFPSACPMVAIEVDDGLGLRLAGASDNALEPILAANEPVLVHAAELAYASRGPVAITSEASLRERLPTLQGALAGHVRSLYGVPLIARNGRGPCIGAVMLLFPDDRALDEHERAFVAAHVEQTTQALARARLSERDHSVAVELQRSLLSRDLPHADGVDLAARYQAGAVGLEVGGDWYDAVRRPDGILHLTVGDVAGRGVVAAALMGQLRNAFRAYAYDHTSPAEIVRHLTRHMSDDEMATTVCLTIDPYTCELAYASAGHMPALLFDGAGDSVWLDQQSAPPLGFAQAAAIHEARTTISAGSTVVAYTDGLVERRGTSIDSGIDHLESVVRTARLLTASALAGVVLEELMSRQGVEDDIALLIVRLVEVPSRMEIEIPAHPAVLAGLRKRLRTWLELRGLEEEERADAVLAISEACNNAVEHAYGNGEGTIELLIEHHPESLQISVADHGAWRPARPRPNRGRGSLIMRSVMDKADVVHDDGGTRVTLEQRLTRRSDLQRSV